MSRNRHALLAAACLVAALVLIWGAWYVFVLPGSPDPEPAQPPSVTRQPLTPTDLQQVRSKFGPWQLAAPGSTGAPQLVMLLNNGGTDVSSNVVEPDDTWKATRPIQITNFAEVDGQVRLRTNEGRIHTVDYGQAFILEEYPESVFAIKQGDPEDVVVSIPVGQL